jgi:hypothetical protein
MADNQRSIRRNIRDMPYDLRHQGYTCLERLVERRTWVLIVTLFGLALVAPLQLRQQFVFVANNLIQRVEARRVAPWQQPDEIDPRNKDRGVLSFSESSCWKNMRFHKEDLHTLIELLYLVYYILKLTKQKSGN